MKKKGLGMLLVFAIFSAAVGALCVNLARANFVVYLPYTTINSDGSVEPETELIERTGDTYTLIANLQQNYAIRV